MINRLQIVLVKLNHDFNIAPFLSGFSLKQQQKIVSYHHYADQLRAFTSRLLQDYYLANILLTKQGDIELINTIYHKPQLKAPRWLAAIIDFNLSHCGDYVAMAVYEGGDYLIGIDIEQVNPALEINDMAPLVFSSYERALIEHSHVNFIKLWTKKEALIKAIGIGFATDFYQDTQLNLKDYEETNTYKIITQQINNYYLSICLYKKVI